MLRRIIVSLAVVLVAAVAPARAWCEASCLAPAPETQAHCPSHESSTSGTQISGSGLSECPTLESARPAAPARLDVQAAPLVAPAPDLDPRAPRVPSSIRPRAATTVFERCTPLRI